MPISSSSPFAPSQGALSPSLAVSSKGEGMVVTPFCSRTLMLPTLLSQNKTPQNSHGRASTFSCSSLPWALVAAAPLVLRRCLGVEEFQLDPQDLMGVCACSAQVSSGSVLRDSLKSVPHRPSLPRLSAQAQGCDSTMKLARTTIPDAAQLSAPHRDARNPETFLHTAPTWRPSITRKRQQLTSVRFEGDTACSVAKNSLYRPGAGHEGV